MASAYSTSVAATAGQAIGKSTVGSLGLGLPSASSTANAPAHGEINWLAFNYPPLLNLIHYDLDELPSHITGMVRLFNAAFVLTCVVCVVNFMDTFIIVVSTTAPGRWVIQSLLHCLLLPTASLWTFYTGYRGIATPDSQLIARYKVAQSVLAFLYLLMALVPWGCINGLAQLGGMSQYTTGSTFWMLAIIVESAGWLAVSAIATVNSIRVFKFDAYGGGAQLGNGNRF
eukprot:gnl/TRDRNA2_/TRDRNA2_81039_c0_seq3.p1 gnl/TRDRNA2_/TRDRNA2_81039_c0~~gnl/TRDRNA2_/TRDRNA2_81039_c0_seq3.p1  ORF type:complete len:229 (-),score=27.55 gnl/TRDRNA2_/TRDRNA2_81039_c0_seq3:174-860(-)